MKPIAARIHRFLLALALVLAVLIPSACQNKSTPTAVARAGGYSLSVSLPVTKEIKASLLGVASNEVWYAVTGPDMSPVTGTAGPFSTSGVSGEVDFSISLSQGPSRLMAFQLNNAANHQPLALGAVQMNVDSSANDVWVTMGSVARACYVVDTSADGGNAYYTFQSGNLATTPAGSDLACTVIGAGYGFIAQGGNSIAYMGNGPLVNFAAVSAATTFMASSTLSKQAAGAPASLLQAGDVYCVSLGAGGANGHAWLQVTNPNQPSGLGPSGPLFLFRFNATLPYFAYGETTADANGTCGSSASPTLTPTLTPTATKTYTPTITPTLTVTPTPTFTSTPIVSTLAGTDVAGFANGPASGAMFNNSSGIAVDSSGDVYVADLNNHVIRKISGGTVSTLAGQAGVTGAGNGSPGSFYYPYSVAVDSSGNVYVADEGNSLIRKITSGGVVSTLAGEAGVTGTNNGQAATALFAYPTGVAVDTSGNVYVADEDNHTIREISGGVVSTLAGQAGVTGAANGPAANATFYYPFGVAVDTSGTVYVAEEGNSLIRKISGGTVSTLAGQAGVTGATNATGTSASFAYPTGVAVDALGNVYVADEKNYLLREITPGGVVSTLAGQAGVTGINNGPAASALFYYPYGVAVDSSRNVYIADEGNNLIREYTP
jgi:sugar lactone lactonase YvrE